MEITTEDRELFQQACEKIVMQERLRYGIGTLSEKTVHAVLKNYLVPKAQYHEIRCEGYVADIFFEDEIIEVQTANFNTLRKKLEAFLQKYEVTIVYPIPGIKWLSWIDDQTGEITKKRKSPKTGSYYQVFPELYKIKQFLMHPNLHLRLVLLEVEEYRLLNGWSQDKKKGSSRFDRIPVNILGDLQISHITDYELLLPDNLPLEFTAKNYKTASRLPLGQAQTALNILNYVECIEKIGKQGRSILYRQKIKHGQENEKVAIEKVRNYFKAYNMDSKIMEFSTSSATVELAAQAVGCEPKRIAKTLSFLLDDTCILIVCAGDAKIDNAKYKCTFQKKAKMPTVDEVLQYVGHEVGGVCPFAINEGISVYLDESLKRFQTVFPACGSSNSAIELTIPELEKYSHMDKWVDVCKDWQDLKDLN